MKKRQKTFAGLTATIACRNEAKDNTKREGPQTVASATAKTSPWVLTQEAPGISSVIQLANLFNHTGLGGDKSRYRWGIGKEGTACCALATCLHNIDRNDVHREAS